MKRNLLVTSFYLISSHAIAIDNLATIKADKAFTANNLAKLELLYQHNSSNLVINYFYAKAMLNKNKALPAEQFVAYTLNSYMKNDILHQLLNFYFNNNNFSSYKHTFNLLPLNQASINEKCGYDLSNIALSSSIKPLISREWLISNNIPSWCANLVGTRYNQGKLDKNERNLMLYNLIVNGKTDIFNQIASSIGIRSINFSHYQNVPISDLSNNQDYTYLAVNRIGTLAKKYPDLAYKEMKQASIDTNTKTFLGNYLAMQFAIKQNFDQAAKLYDEYDTPYLSDEEFEWQVRTNLFTANWKEVINSIDSMPFALKSKNVWLYWKAKAYENLNQTSKANEIFAKIPIDYSYYSMLAQAELGQATFFKTNPPLQFNLSSGIVAKNVRLALNLYRLGQVSHSKNLINLATNEWYYAAKQANETQLLAMSNLAHQAHLFALSIFAANQLSTRYIALSFPIPFAAQYYRYSKLFGIDTSYSLAISRQESRFNYSVIAFDGGVGLMQIMPQTAIYISHKSGLANCYRYGPECNIKFGTWYLGSLYSKFNDNLIYATAAYNAGPNRSRRWQDKLGLLDNKVQIELIPISITRDYVQKVISNKAIYDAQMANQHEVNLLQYINQLNKNHYLNQIDDDNTDAQKIKNSNN